MQKYKSNITTTSGAAVRNVPVHVLAEDGSPAAIFLDRAGTVPASNPLITAADGTFYFYTVNGRYSLRTTVDGVTITDDDVVLMMDPAEITVAGPIAEAVAAAQAAATAAETAVANSGIPVLVSSAQNAVVDANAALAQAIASSNSAALSKTDADAARDAAVTAKMAAEAALDSFDDRYLGAKAVAPTVDNDGAALLIGALYWDTALPGMRSWNGSAWVTLQAATAAAISNTPAGSIAATTVQSAIDELDAEKAPLSSPALTGTPTAPTAAPGTNTTQLATTEYARAAAIAFGGIKAYATKAEAAIASALLPDGEDIEVAQDESLSGARTRYKAQGGALVFVVNLDQTRIDLAAPTGAALVGGASQVVGSIAALRGLLKTSASKTALVTGYYAAGDGHQGSFYLDPLDTTTADNGGTVIVASDGGRWKRVYSGALMAEWFGIGYGEVNSNAGVRAALAALPDGGALDFGSRTYTLVPDTSLLYKDKFNVTRMTAIEITSRTGIALVFQPGSKIIVSGTAAERVGFFFKSCSGVTVSGAYFPNISGLTSIAGADYLDSENYFPFAYEGNDTMYMRECRAEACRAMHMMDAFNGLQNKNIVIDRNRSFQVCNYTLITRNADNIHFTRGRCEQTGRNWNTSNEDVAFSDNSTNCEAEDVIALAPIGTVARFASVNNVGPTRFVNCNRTGGGIWVEINQGSNIQIVGGVSNATSGVSEHILFTSDDFINNANVSVTGAHFYGGGAMLSDYYAAGWGAADIPGLVVTGCVAVGCYGPVLAPQRRGVTFSANRLELANAGQMIRIGGKSAAFEGNTVKNGYLHVDGNNFKAVGNHLEGNSTTPIAAVFDVQGCVGMVEDLNTFEPGTYLDFINRTPASRAGFKKLRTGYSGNPQFGLAAYLTGAVGDEIFNDNPSLGAPERWVCTTAGNPGTWQPIAQAGTRTFSAAPAVNAQFLGETALDSVANRVYYAKNTGTGTNDWVALN